MWSTAGARGPLVRQDHTVHRSQEVDGGHLTRSARVPRQAVSHNQRDRQDPTQGETVRVLQPDQPLPQFGGEDGKLYVARTWGIRPDEVYRYTWRLIALLFYFY